jgi:hypothetical protein
MVYLRGETSIPSTVKVGAIPYTVIQCGETLTIDRKECTGIIDYEQQFIKINTVVQGQQRAEETFYHELIHAIARERGLDWGDNKELYTTELAKGLYQVVKDNPEAFRFE